jgi:hypothetical protein
MKQDIQFIATQVANMTEHIIDPEMRKKVIGKANDYARVRKFPDDKEIWTDSQLGKYFDMLEKLAGTTEIVLPSNFDQMSIDKKIDVLEETGIATEINTNDTKDGLEEASNLVEGIVNKMEETKKYRDDLACPYCKAMVYDNRNSKKSDKSPDFVCSTNDPAICGGHSGKWRKSWWMDNSDLPEEWGI